MPTAFSDQENATCPWRRTISLSTITAIPLSNPRAMRPRGSDQLTIERILDEIRHADQDRRYANPIQP